MNIFVGNLSFDATEADLRQAFAVFGSVGSAVIIMEKKGAKSRGFGFVDMPDDQQAQAAIAALDGKEFMGRPLNVSPAHPKPEAGQNSRKRATIKSKMKIEVQQFPRQEGAQKNTWFSPVFQKRGGYKGGRRTRSFIKQRAAAGIEERADFKRKNPENPMRWRKNKKQPKPWQKSQAGAKPGEKTEGGFNSWRQSSASRKQTRFRGRRKPGPLRK
ncbi:MAG: hypothetical protein WC510_07445 [Candidatus Omnitrophota bacterium]